MRSTPAAVDPAAVIGSQVVLEEHDVAADGSFAVVVRRFVRGNRYRSHLWLVPLRRGGRPIQLTSGAVRDTWPRISPDGRAIAFRRRAVRPAGRGGASRPDEDDNRLFVLPLRGGRPGRPWAVRTPAGRSVGEITWSPDGRRLAFGQETDPPRFLVGEKGHEGEPLARRITRIDWRLDEVGHVDRWDHLHVVEARRGARPVRLTEGDWGVAGLAWSPDGSRIAFTADPRPDADTLPRSSIWTVPADATKPEPPGEVLALGGRAYGPAWSPDGRWLAAIGVEDADAHDDESPGLFVGPADGRAPARAIAPGLDRPIGNWSDTDLFGWFAGSRTTPAWLDERTIVAVVTSRGRSGPWRFVIDPTTGRAAGEPAPLTRADLATYSFALATGPGAPPDAKVTLLGCVDARPMELVTVALPAGDGLRIDAEPRIRTRLGSRWRDRFPWPRMRVVEAPGAGGPIETWIASPEGSGDAPLPTVVDVHGGPLGGWTPAPSIEVVLLCAAGYRVLLPNIRGSAAYGRDWIAPQLGDWGGVDADDVHATVDHAIAAGLADADRIGLLGLSYGGFMVNWLVGTSDRFRAAVSENGVTNQVSAWANSDTGVAYDRDARMGDPFSPAGVDRLWRQSPLANVARIRTPLLILQGEADLRCPPADNEQLFVALRTLGRTVEYVLYPEEFHVYQASGRPDRRIDRMTRILDWFERYLRA